MNMPEIRAAMVEGIATLSGINMALGVCSYQESQAVCVEEFRKELFRLHQQLGKMTGALEREQQDVPPVLIP